ncbi:translation initiation factor III [Actinoplanes sp. G11-F43]|uniref:ferric reductase-like transmembrane domain-containing protein n=1 Tax=Actinoplanes sp. G11-F43 TaxID=3424130 RepID=UPI003D334732
MARSKNNKAAPTRAAVEVGSTGVRKASRTDVILLVLSLVIAVWAVAVMTVPGKIAYYYLFEYLKFYMGVVALVSLSITIMIGLVATDRLVLSIRQRVLLQSAHRTTGVIAVGGLFVHVWTKFIDGQIGVIDIVIPFLVDGVEGRAAFVGMGTISAWVMVLVMWSGLARSRFIGRGKPWMWRGIHAISYLIWPIALMHGLGAGRAAATWVIVAYVVCVVGVLVGLAVRLSVSLNRKKDFASPAGVGAVKNETGTLVPTASAPIRRPSARRAEPPVDLLAPAGGAPQPAANPAWNGGTQQAAGPAWNTGAQPAAQPTQAWSMDTPPPVRPVSPAPAAAPAEDERRRQPELEAPAPRQRRAVEDDERYDTQTRMSRRDAEDDRYRYDDEPAPRSRGGRAQEMYEDAPRGRRFEDDEPAPRSRRRDDLESTSTRMRRDDLESPSGRMRRDDLESPSGRMRRDDLESTSTRMRRDDLESTSTRMRRFEDDEPAPRSRRRDPEPEYDERPRSRRRADDDYDDAPAPRGARPARYEEQQPRYDEPRYDEAPRRPSRSEFVDFTEGDDSPTLVDSGSRRSRRAEPQDGGRGGRRGRDDSDDGYFSQLRGE